MVVSTCPDLVGASYSSTGNILEELSPLPFLNADGFTEFNKAIHPQEPTSRVISSTL